MSACQLLNVSLTRDTATHHENLNIIGCGLLSANLDQASAGANEYS